MTGFDLDRTAKIFHPGSRLALCAVLSLCALVALATWPAQAQRPMEGFADLAERVAPAVVNIRASQTVGLPRFQEGSPLERYNEFYDDLARPESSAGSGFVIDPSGIVVTNEHVIRDADQLEIAFSDGRTFRGELIGEDEDTDLAVIQIITDDPLPYVKFGDSDASRVGDWVVAIGNPLGIGSTLTVGVISGRDRNISFGAYDNFIQTDAAINPGNSGGPLFNTDGQVIGVNSAIISPTGVSVGLGFSIPSNLAHTIVERLRSEGQIRRGSLGVRVQAVDARLAEAYGLDRPTGALISDVTEDGPAAVAGVQPGDLILQFNGGVIDNERALSARIAEAAIGETISLDILRAGREQTIEVAVEERQLTKPRVSQSVFAAPVEPGGAATALGVSVAPLEPAIVRTYRAYGEAEYGVVITYVDPTADAANYLRKGDIIAEIDFEPVRSPQAATRLAEAAALTGEAVLVWVISSSGDARYIAIRPVLEGERDTASDAPSSAEE